MLLVSVAVAQGKAQTRHGSQVTGDVLGLLGRPLRARMRGDAGDVDLAGVMFEEYQCIQSFVGDRVQVEGVCGDDSLGPGGEELAPGAGSMPAACGIVQTVDGAIRCPSRATRRGFCGGSIVGFLAPSAAPTP